MAGRPRLVHEGSPIIDEGDDDLAPPNISSWINERESHPPQRQQQSLGSLASRAGSITTTQQHRKPYKLQTRLVIGDVAHEDDAAMEEDNHAEQHADNYNAIHTGHHHYGYSHSCDVHHQQHHYTLGGPIEQSQTNLQTAHIQMNNHPPPISSNAHHQQHHYTLGGPIEPSHNNLQTAHVQINNPPPPAIFHNMPSPAKSPLIVIDGANIAYNYAESLDPSSSLETNNYNQSRYNKRQPNPHGIRLAIEYFLSRKCRVTAVVPTSWYRLRPRSKNEGDAKMVTDEVDELRSLREQGFLVACPPGDDDDAYSIALARREEDRQKHKATTTAFHEDDAMMDDDEDGGLIPESLLGGFVLSNDFFHDAVRREEQARKDHHQFYSAGVSSLSGRKSSLREWLKQNRISYSFANVGQIFQGQVEMEFLPNPRHPLIECIEARHRFGDDL
eukprot:scaffold39118_cov206-Skeletonema_marinoi.AAC.4